MFSKIKVSLLHYTQFLVFLIKNNSSSILIKGKIEQPNKKIFKTVTNIIENMKNQKSYPRRQNRFLINSSIKYCFVVYYDNYPKNIVKELEKIQKNYLWKNSISKIEHKSLCYDYKAGGLKTVDIPYKITAL